MDRPDTRQPHEMRPVSFEPGVAPNADGSVLVSFGNTRVICAACLEEGVPGWMKYQQKSGGWLTAEYSMLPYSTLDRKPRDIAKGKLDGRSSEIQRLIGRAMRAAVDLGALGSRTLWIDCDVLQADGGTRTAAITGASVAVALALDKARSAGSLKTNPLLRMVSAVSVGIVKGEAVLDLNYEEDSAAEVDSNVVMTDALELIEVQSSGEEAVFSRQQLQQMLDFAEIGIRQLLEKQSAVLTASRPLAAGTDLQALATRFRTP